MFTLLRIYFDEELRIQSSRENREPRGVVEYSMIDFIIVMILLIIYNLI